MLRSDYFAKCIPAAHKRCEYAACFLRRSNLQRHRSRRSSLTSKNISHHAASSAAAPSLLSQFAGLHKLQRQATTSAIEEVDRSNTEPSSLSFAYQSRLQQLDHLVAALQTTTQTGPALLELLADLEITRSNLLRPASYFLDFSISANQQAEAQQLQQYVITMTAPVYMDTTLLLLLLQTVQQALQELASAAAAAAAATALDLSGSSRSLIVVGQVQYVGVGPDLAVNSTGAAAAVSMAAAACKTLSQLIREQNESGTASSPEIGPAAIAARQACLRAVDAALNSTIPASSSSSSKGPVVKSIKEGAMLLGGHCVQYLMLCRQLVASWIPPLVVEAAAGNNNIAVDTHVTTVSNSVREVSSRPVGESDNVTAVGDRQSDSPSQALDNAQIFKADSSDYCVESGCNADNQREKDTGNQTAAAAAQRVHGSSCCQDPATATLQSNAEVYPQSVKPLQQRTIRQLLQSALTTLSAVSSSSSSDCSVIAPLILMTADQAAVLQPLLTDAGLVESPRHQQQQQQQGQGAVLRSSGGTENGSSSSSSSSAFNESPWIPLITDSRSVSTSTTVAQETRSTEMSAQRQQQQQQYPVIVQGSDGDNLILQTSATLTVHEGPGGQVLLTDLVSVTDHAQQVIMSWQQQQQQQQQQQDHDGDLIIAAALPLCLLRVSSDVVQLLLRCHPNPGVRQLLHQCGLLPLLSIQEQVLGVILHLRQQLASQHSVPDYTHLILSGSCIGTAAAAAGLLQQLEPVLREYACTEHEELAAAAARAARAAGRWGGSSSSVDPWDLAYIRTDLGRRSSDLDWGRDIAPYFTLPGLFDRIDALLNATCGLRLLPAAAASAAVAGQHGRSSSSSRHDTLAAEADHSGIHLWGPHVMHFVLGDSTIQPQPQQQQQQQQQYGGLILGNIFVELVQGWGFPFCSLLQLPQTTASNRGAHHEHNNDASQTDVEPLEAPAAATAAAAVGDILPASVVIRLPLPTAKPVEGFGHHHHRHQQQQQQVCGGPDVSPIALPGPAALQALLHELGHALSYLCPYATLTQHRQQQQQGGTCADQTEASPSSASSSSAAAAVGRSPQPAGQAVSTTTTTSSSSSSSSSSSQTSHLSVFSPAIGPCGMCLLCGSSAGVDVREMSSHVFEHWARSPTAVVALSCHERLGVPLPHHTALQLPQLMMAAAGPGAGSSMKFHASILEAEADLDMHMQQQQPGVQGWHPQQQQQQQQCLDYQQQQQQLEGKGRVSDGFSNTDSNKWSRVHDIRRILCGRSVPSGAETLEEVEELSALGPVGGTKAAYVMAKLLAAATWKHLGFEREPTGHSSGGSRLKGVLLRGGCYQPGHHTVMRLLDDVDVLEPVVLQMAGLGCGTSDQQQDDVTANSWVSGWVPNLSHAAYQDLDLL